MKQELQEARPFTPMAVMVCKKVLLVDESMENLFYYTSILRHLAFEVRPCASFTEAANVFAREDFELVVVGPGATAFEGRAVLARAVEACGETPLLVLTRDGYWDWSLESIQPGTIESRERPLTRSEVAELVSRSIRHSEA